MHTNWRNILGVYGAFLPFLRTYRGRILLAYVFLIGKVGITVLEPWPLKIIFDCVLSNKPVAGFGISISRALLTKAQFLAALCVAMVIITAVSGVFHYLNRYLLSAVGQGVVNDVRGAIFERLQTISVTDASPNRTGDLVLRLTSDIKALRDLLVNHLESLSSYILSFVMTVGVMLLMDWRLTLLALVIVPPLIVLSSYFSVQIEASAARRQKKESQVASIVQETMSSVMVVQAFVREKDEQKLLARESDESLRAALRTSRLGRALNELVRLLNTTGVALVLWYGVSRVLRGTLTAGDIVVFAAYTKELYKPINEFSDLVVDFFESLVSGRRLLELVQVQGSVKNTPGAVPAKPFRGGVDFKGVTFGYGDEIVLNDVSFHISPGQTVGLVGPSGAGKSTIIKLLLRLADPWEGRVLIDGCDIRSFTLDSVRSQVSVVPQEPVLFRRTIRENIAYGKPTASMEEIITAAMDAQAHEFIQEMHAGYDTVLEERGENLSGGQRQRIALARAILKSASILVLDEPAAGLDVVSESQLYTALRRSKRGRTTFLIAHKISTVQDADMILVVEDGNTVETGSHNELLLKSPVYRHMSTIQAVKAGAFSKGVR